MFISAIKIDFLVETGLGGRLDATNIIPKKFMYNNAYKFDHQNFLATLTKITKEKLGIVKNSDFVIISKQNKEVNVISNKLLKFQMFIIMEIIMNQKIDEKKFEFKFKSKRIVVNKPNLNGYHQIENASVALAFSEIISQKNYNINFNKVNNAIKNTKWPGRLEIINYKDKNYSRWSHNIMVLKLKNF